MGYYFLDTSALAKRYVDKLAAALELAESLQVLDLSPLVFVSADSEQRAAAVAESLEILHPLAAPN